MVKDSSCLMCDGKLFQVYVLLIQNGSWYLEVMACGGLSKGQPQFWCCTGRRETLKYA